jgi:hypothetical protein
MLSAEQLLTWNLIKHGIYKSIYVTNLFLDNSKSCLVLSLITNDEIGSIRSIFEISKNLGSDFQRRVVQ